MNTRKTKRWHENFSRAEGVLLTSNLSRAKLNFKKETDYLILFNNQLESSQTHGESLSRRSPLNEKKIEMQKEAVGSQTRIVSTMLKRVELLEKDADHMKENPYGGDVSLKLMEKLEKHPMIAKIKVEGDRLIVFTKPLKAEIIRTDGEDAGENYGTADIGTYKITIYNEGNPEIRNQTLLYNGSYDHWAIADGQVCGGDYNDHFQKLRKAGNVFLYVDTLLHFLTDAVGRDLYIERKEWIDNAVKIEIQEREQLQAPLRYHDIMLGDFVEITDYKQYYPRWTGLADQMSAKHWKQEKQPENGMYGKLINSKESTPMGSVALIDNGESQFLINYGGIREIEEDSVEEAIENRIKKRDVVEKAQTINVIP